MFNKHHPTPRPKGSVRRVWRAALAATLCVASSATIGVASLPQQQAQAVAGNPGVPGNATTVWSEDFEYKSTATASPLPVNITAYKGATGTTYTSSAYWSDAAKCNGMVLTRNSEPQILPGVGIPSTLCAGVWQVWDPLRILSQKLSNKFGKTGDKFTVASYTAGDGNYPADFLQAKTSQIPLPVGGAFLTTAVDTAALNCNASGPSYYMALVDASGYKQWVAAGDGINPCNDPKATIDNSIDGENAYIARSVGESPKLVYSPSVSIELENRNVLGYGNDATFDNLQLLDVTPQLDKTFTSPVAFGQTSIATFTITNTYGPDGSGAFTKLDAKPGWSFTDQLPTGLTVAGTPFTGSGATACGNFNSNGTTSGVVKASGDLAAGQVYCTISVPVKATAPGTYVNLASDVVWIGLKKPADASVVFTASPSMTLKKSGAVTDTNTNGVTDAGDKVAYSFVVTNTGNVPLNNVAVTDAKVGAVTCNPTTAPVGGSVVCTANAPYTLTLADVNAGSVVNTASASGTDAFSGAKVTATDTLTTPIVAVPKLTLTKTAGTPSDVNKSGLVDAGDTVSYTFKITNTGNVSMSSPRVVDPTLGTVTCPAAALAPGQSADCTGGPYTLTASDQAAGLHTNNATAYAKTPTGTDTPSNVASTTTAMQTPKPSLSLKKTAGTPTDVNKSGLVDPGDTIAFTFVVTNNGNVPASAIAVSDPLIGAVTCPVTTLAVGASTTCTSANVYTITAADKTAGLVTNTATATGKDPNGASVTSPPSSTTTAVATPAPALTFTKKAGAPVDVNKSGITDAGDTIEYTFTVTNNGNVPIKGVTVNDTIAGAVTCALVDLDPGQTTDCAAVSPYVIKTADEVAGVTVNTASATGKDPNGTPVTSNTATTTTSVVKPNPSLTFTKTAGAPSDVNKSGITDAGDTIVYTFTVTNNGNVPMANIAVSDPLVGSTTCAATTLAVGATTTCTASPYTITGANEVAGSVKNSASATGVDPTGKTTGSNTATTTTPVVAPAPSLTLVKTAGTPVDVNKSGVTDAGDTIAYTFTVTNAGNVPMSSIAISDAKVGTVVCPATTLSPGQSTVCTTTTPYTVTSADVTSGSVINNATVTGVTPGGVTVVSKPSTTTTPVVTPAPALQLTKTASPPVDANKSTLVDAGDTIQYNFTVTNTGNVPVTALTVIDSLAGSVTCAATTLDVKATTTCKADKVYTITAAQQTAGIAHNMATATAKDPDNKQVMSNSATTDTPVQTPVPAILLTKSAGIPSDVNKSGLVDAGDTIAYSFTVTNTGNVPLSAVRIDDPLVGAVTCAKVTLAVKETTTCTAQNLYVIKASDMTAKVIVNTATAYGTSPAGATVPSNAGTTTTPVATPTPSILLTKSAAPSKDVNQSGLADAGDTIQYSFTVTNTGNVPLTALVVNDPLAGKVTCEATALAVGALTKCTADNVYTITAADQKAGRVDNVATATAVNPDGAPVTSNAGQTSSPVAVPLPSLNVQKSALPPVDVNKSGMIDAGDTIGYEFVVNNNGNVPMTGIHINDALIGNVTCPATTLAVGATMKCTADKVYTITAANQTAGSVVNSATVTGVDPNGVSVASKPSTTTTVVRTPAPSILLTKTAADPVDVNNSGLRDAGDTIQYSFTVTNTGNVPLTGISVSDPLAGAVTCQATTLAISETTTCKADKVYVITAENQTAGFVTNTAVSSGVSPDGSTVKSNNGQATTPLAQPKAALTIDKTASAPVDVNSSGLTDAGDTIRFSFKVTNNGNVPLTDIRVVDPMVTNIKCSATSLAVNASTDCAASDYTIVEKDETAGAVKNVAHSTGIDPAGKLVTSNNDDTSTPVAKPNPRISLTKEAVDSAGAPRTGGYVEGDPVSYRFTVYNHGNVAISNLKIADPLVGTSTCQTTVLAVGASTVCKADKAYIVTANDANAGKVINTAVANGTYGASKPIASQPATVTITINKPVITIPSTGSSAKVLAGGGALLIVVGGLTWLATVRRRDKHTAQA